MELVKEWGKAEDDDAREAVWRKVLSVWTDEVFTIGIVSGVEQLVVVNNRVKNVPEHGTYNFDPGAYFGMYRPETFWLQ
jgi:peptide/nickel transport system substrate-binding protein